MTGTRIDFVSVDAARFNQLRDQWRGMASSLPLSRSGLRVAAVLPTYVNREFGYAFPTDDDLSRDIGADPKTVKRGLQALDTADLIERKTRTKRGEDGRTPGKERRIYLTFPEGFLKTEETSSPKGQDEASPKGQLASSPKGQPPKGQPKGQASPKGQKRPTEGTPVCPYILDSTPDKDSALEREAEVTGYVSPLSPKGQFRPFQDPAPSPPPKPLPSFLKDDPEFAAAFDRMVIGMTSGREIGAGEIERIAQEAFEAATASDELFIPWDWHGISKIPGDAWRNWFRQRAGQLIHRKEAA